MNATISSKGQLVIPVGIREQARLREGDTVDIGFTDGLVVIRKRLLLNSTEVRAMLAGGSNLPDLTPDDEAEVAGMIATLRRERRARSRKR